VNPSLGAPGSPSMARTVPQEREKHARRFDASAIVRLHAPDASRVRAVSRRCGAGSPFSSFFRVEPRS
jgi:hypothetical protein